MMVGGYTAAKKKLHTEAFTVADIKALRESGKNAFVVDGDVLIIPQDFVKNGHPGGEEALTATGVAIEDDTGSLEAVDITSGFVDQKHTKQAATLARSFLVGRFASAKGVASESLLQRVSADTESKFPQSDSAWEEEKDEIIYNMRNSWWGWRVSVVPYVVSAIVGVATYVVVAKLRARR